MFVQPICDGANLDHSQEELDRGQQRNNTVHQHQTNLLLEEFEVIDNMSSIHSVNSISELTAVISTCKELIFDVIATIIESKLHYFDNRIIANVPYPIHTITSVNSFIYGFGGSTILWIEIYQRILSYQSNMKLA